MMEMQLILAVLACRCRVRLASPGPLVRHEWREDAGGRAGGTADAAPAAGPSNVERC